MFWAAVSALFQLDFAAVLAMSFHVFSSSFGKVSEETLETFSVLLCGFSILHWHGVFFPVRNPCFGLPCLLAVVFLATVLAVSFLALLEKFQRRR